ncbi:MAG: hypothetical protein Hyperionvirus2_196 [Hyperionvirus sp.]|uniref:Uncharacterized protein n=1 Tax=Hyperionvirus sp. TaxID=2487770 RepID=A0A3G5A6M3_9VIRU|nr:MAG: hypothetical protein Hyperionvirus2_196 [Hyperionvirus sp.]
MIDPVIAIVLSYLRTGELLSLCRSETNYRLITDSCLGNLKEFPDF